MKFRPILLCSAVVLFAAAPIWADRIDSMDAYRSGDEKVFADTSFGSIHVLGDWFGAAKDIKFPVGQFTDPFPGLILPSSQGDIYAGIHGGAVGRRHDGVRDVVATPEPATFSLLALGLFGLGLLAYRRKESPKIIDPCEQLSGAV